MREFRFCIKYIFNRYEFYVALFVSLFIGGFHAVYTVQANQVLPDAGFSGDYLFILFNIFQNVYSFLILILPIALGLILSDSNWQEKYRGTETMLAVRLNRKKLIISRFIMSIIMSFVVAISGLLLNYLILRGCYGGGYRMTYNQEMPFAIRGKTYIKMQDQLLKDDDCACYLVEAIAKKSQNIKWETSVNGNKVSHKRIRRVSIDQFYSLVTGEADAFYQICMVLPDVISDVIKDGSSVSVPKDTVLEELSNIAKNMDASSEELSMAMAIYLLGFSSYSGFTKSQDENMINRIYEYAKRINKI